MLQITGKHTQALASKAVGNISPLPITPLFEKFWIRPSFLKNLHSHHTPPDTINELGAQPLTDVLTSLGGWPVLGDNPAGGNWDPAAFDLEKLWADLRGKYGMEMFVATGTWPDPDNSTKYKLDVSFLNV